MKIFDLINRQRNLNKEERELEDYWNKLAEEFIDRPYVSEFLKMHNARALYFDYLEMRLDVSSFMINLYVWWRYYNEKELICRIYPEELDKFMTDNNYMIDLLKEKSKEEEKQIIMEEEKKKTARYEQYKKLKEEFE